MVTRRGMAEGGGVYRRRVRQAALPGGLANVRHEMVEP